VLVGSCGKLSAILSWKKHEKTIRGDIQSSSNGHPPIAPKAHGSKDSRHARLHEEKLKMMCAVHRKTKKTIVKSPFVTIKMNY